MKDLYPELETVPSDQLVGGDAQPDYVEPSTAKAVPPRVNVGEYLSDQQVALGYGRQIATIDAGDGGVQTFADLSRRSNQIAAALIRLGVRPGDRVAYRSPNVSSVITLMAGI